MRSVDRQVIPPDVLEQRLFGMTMPEINRQKQMLSAGAIEARNNLEKARLLFEAQQKEKAMPDIKTALQQALAKTATDWAADDEAHSKIEPQQEKAMTEAPAATETTDTSTDPRVTTNVSRATFYFIRDNAGLTAQQITTQLMAQGYKATSVTSLIGQMLRMRIIMEDEQRRLSAVIKEYIPIQAKPGKTSKPAKAKPAAPVQQRKRVEIVNTRTGEVINPKPADARVVGMAPALGAPFEWTVDSVIGSLNVRQAMAVYAELRKIFGE